MFATFDLWGGGGGGLAKIPKLKWLQDILSNFDCLDPCH